MDLERRIEKLEEKQEKLEDRITSILQEISQFKPILEQIKDSIWQSPWKFLFWELSKIIVIFPVRIVEKRFLYLERAM